MTSNRKRKKQALAEGLTTRELELAELLEEILDAFRWMQILGYSNQYLLKKRIGLNPAEQKRVLEAATRAVDRDAKLHEWHERLARVKGEAARIQRSVGSQLDDGGGDAAPRHAAMPERELGADAGDFEIDASGDEDGA